MTTLTGTTTLRLGTRSSALATSQSAWVADRVRAGGRDVELVPVETEGDLSRAPLSVIGGTGVFVGALRRALLDGRIDLAVHSLKDLPVAEAPGLVVAAVPVREDPRDVVVARDRLTLQDLPDGAVVGTGSPRRAAQLRHAVPGLVVRDVRGNVDTRIAKVAAGRFDAVVLAAAGLRRLDRWADVTQVLEPDVMLPAPGQGALAVECRADDRAVREAVGPLEHQATRTCVTAERTVLAALEAGCSAPVGALAQVGDGELVLTALVAVDDTLVRHTLRGTDPIELGHQAADHLLAHVGRPPRPHAIPPTTTEHDQ